MLIAGGIGITPYWQWLEAGLGQNTTLVRVISDPMRLEWIRPMLNRMRGGRLLIFLTAGVETLPQWVAEHGQLKVQRGRPCWQTLANSLSKAEAGDCHLCGPGPLMSQAGRSFRRRNWHVYKESF